ncbi:MAG: DUF58 domain-containing protein [Nitrospirae bacterium]|nr:DUF58 domain-containing protein [Nitrospirota bacterium]
MKTTKEGKRFIVAAFLILVAAFNTGNNLIYLVLSLMFAFLFLSLLILKTNLSGAEVVITAEGPVYAGDETTLDISLINRKKTFPCYSINVSDREIGMKSYFLFVPASGALSRKAAAVFKKRGFYRGDNVRIVSGYPFILFSKTIAGRSSANILVYPAYYDLNALDHEVREKEGEGRAVISGKGDEMLYMRLFRAGDDFRNIHWKSLAKSSALMVKEYSSNETAKITLFLDNSPAEDRDNFEFEKVISITATLARDYLEKGFFVRMMSGSEVTPYGYGYEHLLVILDRLALIREEEVDAEAISEDEKDGLTICVLRSADKGGTGVVPSCDLVIYADSV